MPARVKKTEEKKPDSRGRRIRREILSFLRPVLIACGISLLLTQGLFVNATVPTGSMKDTIEEKDRLIAFRLAYLWEEPKRGDIIIFDPEDYPGEHFIKRVIGLPGETVEGRDGYVYIDGRPLEEPYVRETLASDFGPFTVPEESYFVMGDNRNRSKDSRYWEHPYVDKEDILGKALFRYYPGLSLYEAPDYGEAEENQ
ncbi:MAG TPA: signal peptidase I [Firmicutes bacterium]|nr:signal peptidase I [Bacillota bacterium]